MENINYTTANDDDTATVGAGTEMIHALEFLVSCHWIIITYRYMCLDIHREEIVPY